ncbi:multidrug ABC transporter ATP-binding protein [Sulfolobales archaeon HS-7]|nr:multidrug ABC transporter ATP-binding protein [Sulfolobales archaeon HS-7]
MDVISVEHLFKEIDGKGIISDATFSVIRGAIAGFIGPNGAGKTTTIKILAGLFKKTSGKVEVLGGDPWERPQLRRKYSVIFDRLYFPPHNTVTDYLVGIASVLNSEGEVPHVIEEFGLEDYRGTSLGKLSAGYKQKVQLAASLLNDPELIIADEPTANLDPKARIEFEEIVRELNSKSSITFFISSHILTELERLITHVVVISSGRIVACSPLEKEMVRYTREEITILTDNPDMAVKALVKFNPVRRGSYVVVKGNLREMVDALDDAGVKVLQIRRSSLDDIFSSAT